MLSLSTLPSLPTPTVSPYAPQLPPVCDAPLPESMCSRWSAPTYEWEHMVFGFLFLGQFAKNDGFQIHPSPYKVHEHRRIFMALYSTLKCGKDILFFVLKCSYVLQSYVSKNITRNVDSLFPHAF